MLLLFSAQHETGAYKRGEHYSGILTDRQPQRPCAIPTSVRIQTTNLQLYILHCY